jgi:D-3-phosphoglycerate dehydrogenase
MLILICDAFDASLPQRLTAFGEVTTDMGRLPEADIALIRSKTKCTADWIAGAPKLKLIIRGGVGIDNIDQAAAKAKGIQVRNTPLASAIAVAELTFAFMIAVPNRLVEAHNSMREGKWLKKELKRTELHGKTLGLVGIGHIGSEVALRARAFGMRVLAYDPYVKSSEHAQMVTGLKELLGEADYVSLHLPLTDETRGMINAESIAWMKDGVVIINTGRGKCVVEEDLAGALAGGKVAVYATDVFTSDPPPPESPILSAPNVLLTPHIGASSKENLLRIGNEVVEILSGFKA